MRAAVTGPLQTGNDLLTRLAPGWNHPRAVTYISAVDMMSDIVPGDQVVVVSPSKYHRHGIYVGKQLVAGINRPAVVDFWGESKDRTVIGLRSLTAFTHGATGFVKAVYPQGAALNHEVSAQLALAWAGAGNMGPSAETIPLENGKAFATICRCMMCAAACHNALKLQLARLPAIEHRPCRRGFKWSKSQGRGLGFCRVGAAALRLWLGRRLRRELRRELGGAGKGKIRPRPQRSQSAMP